MFSTLLSLLATQYLLNGTANITLKEASILPLLLGVPPDTATLVAAPNYVQLLKDDITDDIIYYLYTKENPKDPDVLQLNNTESLDKSHFKKERQTVFITHGYLSGYESEACTLSRDEYLKSHVDLNVIVVDWSKAGIDHLIAAKQHYLYTAIRVEPIGQVVGRMIEFMANNSYLKYEETILSGHSLGAHVMGVAGYRVGGKLKAIFGLDPAKPSFDGMAHPFRISKEDAAHVQLIHTNMGIFGTDEMKGHIDFIVNDGSGQPGCPIDLLPCAHSRAYEYFAESINSKVGFWGNRCSYASDVPTCEGAMVARMGGLVPYDLGDDHVSRIYHVVTNSTKPFALGLTYTHCHNGYSGPCSDYDELRYYADGY